MKTVYLTLISMLHIFGHKDNANEKVKSNIQTSKKEYKTAALHEMSTTCALACLDSADNYLLYLHMCSSRLYIDCTRELAG